MGINLTPVSAKFGSLTRLQDIYVESFPPEERRPWPQLLERAFDDSDSFILYAITDGDIVAGLVTVWHLQAARYIEHFAIALEYRGKGTGTSVLAMLVSMSPLPMLLEVEPAATGDTARRRIDFYRRNGFIGHPDFDYIQPPYAPGLPAVPLMLMTTGKVNLQSAATELFSTVYG